VTTCGKPYIVSPAVTWLILSSDPKSLRSWPKKSLMLTIWTTVQDRGLVRIEHLLEIIYCESCSYMTADVMWPLKVNVITYFVVIISIFIAVLNLKLFLFLLTIAVGFGPPLQFLVIPENIGLSFHQKVFCDQGWQVFARRWKKPFFSMEKPDWQK